MNAPTFDEAALSTLAIFPLPNVVLLPRALLPLQIFEPRYRDMMRDVLEGSKLMAIPRLIPGYESEYEGRPPIFPIAGLGEVVVSEKMPDGRYQFMMRGIGRVAIHHELPPNEPYRIASCTLLGDRATPSPELLEPMRQQVALKSERLAAIISDHGDALRAIVRDNCDPGSYADLIGGALVTDIDARQQLLEQLDPAKRLDQVVTHVSALLSRLGNPDELLN